jgi:hypothetical protein
LFARVYDERGNRFLSPEWLGDLAAFDCREAGSLHARTGDNYRWVC